MNYTIAHLEQYNMQIEALVEKLGLNCYPQEFEIISFEDMLCYEAYVGMPSHYSHWSYGKAYDRLKTTYQYNLTGLPYEMVINSNPCIAYLMKDNSLLLQILTIAHVYGHNDFFKNNEYFKTYTNAKLTVEMFKNHADRIRNYIQDPSIGYEAVERILDAAHAIRYQCHSFRRVPFENIKEVDYPCDNLLEFLASFGQLEDWEKDILFIVSEESRYFIPQVETKIMNEGWATFWHYTLLNELQLEQGMMVEFYKLHNGVICQRPGQINPYYMGFQIWQSLYKQFEGNFQKMAEVRRLERDASFIRKYLNCDLCLESHLCEFHEEERYYVVSEVADDNGWKTIRNTLANQVGLGGIPLVEIKEVIEADRTLVLEHLETGKELNLSYATETLKHIQTLWGGKIILRTTLSGTLRRISCNTSKKVSIENE